MNWAQASQLLTTGEKQERKVWRLYIGSGQNAFFEGVVLDSNFCGMVVLEQNAGDRHLVYFPHESIKAAELLS